MFVITSISILGSYVCVAENSGGVQEKTVTLTFDDPVEWPGNQPLSPDQMSNLSSSRTPPPLLSATQM